MSCLKKVSLSVATLAVSASAFAGTDLDSRVRELEKEMKQVRTETAQKTFGANTVTARPNVDGYGFFVSFDVLYWQLRAGGTEYCATETIPTFNLYPSNGRLKEANFNKWDWGFRAGLGYNFVHGEWDVYANYTYFTADNSSLTSEEDTSATGTGIYPSPVVVSTGTTTSANFVGTSVANSSTPGYVSSYGAVAFVNKATSTYKFSFNRIDLELGRDFFVAKYLALRPHIGLVSAWIRQHQTITYTGLDLSANTYTIHNTNHFWGIGPRGGLNTKWYLCNGFSLIGNMSGALVYGKFDLSNREVFSLNPSTNATYLNGDMHRFTPTTQLQLGFGYDKSCSCDTQHVSIFLAWDIQYWWRLQQQMKPNLGYARYGEDVSLQGATLHLRWDF